MKHNNGNKLKKTDSEDVHICWNVLQSKICKPNKYIVYVTETKYQKCFFIGI